MRKIVWTMAATIVVAAAALVAQSADAPEFDIVSIKRNTSPPGSGGGMRRLPDGTFIMTNQPLIALVGSASPVFVMLRDIIGAPDWMMRESYDVTVRPPAGLSQEQLRDAWPAMMRAMFADRMKLAAHVEEREADTFALVVARKDGRLGPQLKRSALDCGAPPTSPAPPPAPRQGPPSPKDFEGRCGGMATATSIVSGGMKMDQLALSLGGRVGGRVENRTGLDGYYALTLEFAPPSAASPDAPRSDAPQLFTAIQEQLGLKLQREKSHVPVFVIDHVERPTEN